MKPIATPLGNFRVLEGACEQQIAAELRGLSLLREIVEESKVWSIDDRSSRPFLVSNDGAPGISVDIFSSMKSRILGGDPHLHMMMAQRPVCVLRTKSDVMTPSTDSMVSLVLLGNMGWPQAITPETLIEKSIAREAYPNPYMEHVVYHTEEDHEEMAKAKRCLDEGKPMQAIGTLVTIARRWYVCRGWDMDMIQPIMEELLLDFNPLEIDRYLESPEAPEDDLFLVF